MAAVLACAQRAIAATLADPLAWDEEGARQDAPPLPWPLMGAGKGYPQLLRNLVQQTVEGLVLSLLEASAAVPRQAVPLSPVTGRTVRLAVRDLDPADPLVQLLLRMARRAVDAADAAMVREFGGRGRLDGKAEYKQWADRTAVEAALAAGHSVVEAARAMGRSPETLYKRLRKPSR